MWGSIKVAALAAAVGFGSFIPPVYADTLALDFTGATESTDPSRVGGLNAGWTFDVLSPVTLTALGIWDEDSDGLVTDHTVTLWDSTGTAIASTTLNNSATPMSSSTPQGRWLFSTTFLSSGSPLILTAGNYTISAFYDYSAATADHLRFLSTATTDPAIDFGAGVYNLASSVSRPTGVLGAVDDGIFGPNFLFTRGAVGAIPEPQTWVLMIAGFAGLGLALRRRVYT